MKELRAESSRLHWMDAARGAAVTLVILFHSATILRRFNITGHEWVFGVNAFFAPFRMPLLIFLSGMLLSSSRSKGTFAYLDGKWRRIGYPYLIWTVVAALIIGSPYHWLDPRFWLGSSYLWYLLFILFYYVLALCLKSFPPLLIVAAALAVSFACPDGSKYGERLFFLMAFFFLGDWAAQKGEKWTKFLGSRWTLAALPMTIIFAILSATHGPFGYKSELFPFIFVSIIGSIWVSIEATRIGIMSAFAFIGKNSLILYVIHYPVNYIVVGNLLKLGVSSPAIYLASGVTASILAGILFIWGSAHSRAISLLFVAPPTPRLLPSRRKAGPCAACDNVSANLTADMCPRCAQLG